MHGTRKTNGKVRSRITSGRSTFLKVDGHRVDMRSQYARRFADLFSLHTAELGPTASEAELAIIRRAVTLIVWLEQAEASFATDDEAATVAKIESYGRTASTMRRLLESVGLGRRAKDVTPSLKDYQANRKRRPLTIEHDDG
jgi:hypothetical protein